MITVIIIYIFAIARKTKRVARTEVHVIVAVVQLLVEMRGGNSMCEIDLRVDALARLFACDLQFESSCGGRVGRGNEMQRQRAIRILDSGGGLLLPYLNRVGVVHPVDSPSSDLQRIGVVVRITAIIYI